LRIWRYLEVQLQTGDFSLKLLEFVAQRGVALLSLFWREKSVLGSDTPDGKLLVAVKHGELLTSCT
jgi:hypothetical protein